MAKMKKSTRACRRTCVVRLTDRYSGSAPTRYYSRSRSRPVRPLMVNRRRAYAAARRRAVAVRTRAPATWVGSGGGYVIRRASVR